MKHAFIAGAVAYVIIFLGQPAYLLSHSEDTAVKRIYDHLVIKDYTSASQESTQALNQFPQSKPLWQAHIKTLAQKGDEKEMMTAWFSFINSFPEEKNNRDLMECLAWGVIEKAANSSQPNIRIFAMLGAYMGQDAKGVAILHAHLKDQNSFLRSVAVQLSASMRDARLCDEILRMVRQDPVWQVRLEAIKAIGSMKIFAAKPELIQIVSDDRCSAEEKAAAIESLVNMLEAVERGELEALVHSPRAGLRLLACQVISHLNLTSDIDLIIPLLHDSQAEVRAAALYTLGITRTSVFKEHPIEELVAELAQDHDPYVGVTAAWVMTLNHKKLGQNAFKAWLKDEKRETRILAAAALASTGKYGFPLTLDAFNETPDAYVKMNLGMALITQRIAPELGCRALYDGLKQEKERWMWEESGFFKALAPSKISYDETIPNKPEAVNQITRLEVLNILALMNYPQAFEAIKEFLQEKIWGLTGLATVLLLTEGDENAADIVQRLLSDSNQKVRFQAALILALWGQGEDAISVLQQAYKEVDRELKERILEGLGKIGSESSIPFLIDKMQEPYQSLRVIAAAALLECLYH